MALTLTGAFAERGHEVDLLVMQKQGELIDLVPAGVRLVDLGAGRTRNVLRPLIRYLRERRPDALQVSMWPLTVIGIIAARLSRVRVRVVVSDHSSLSHHYPRSKHAAIRATTRLFYPWANGRTAVSDGAADDLANLSGLPRPSFEVIPNPIDFPATLERRPDVEALWGGCAKRILTVGNLKPEKNHALLIGAFARLPRALDARLMICGDGQLRQELEARAEKDGIADRVIFAGYAADPWPYYASADLFALSSQQESFGNVLVEALYAGLPIVSTDTLGARQVLEDGKWGKIVPQGDAATLAEALAAMIKTRPDANALRRRAVALSGEAAVACYENLLL